LLKIAIVLFFYYLSNDTENNTAILDINTSTWWQVHLSCYE